jgi:hypothetical protein
MYSLADYSMDPCECRTPGPEYFRNYECVIATHNCFLSAPLLVSLKNGQTTAYGWSENLSALTIHSKKIHENARFMRLIKTLPPEGIINNSMPGRETGVG